MTCLLCWTVVNGTLSDGIYFIYVYEKQVVEMRIRYQQIWGSWNSFWKIIRLSSDALNNLFRCVFHLCCSIRCDLSILVVCPLRNSKVKVNCLTNFIASFPSYCGSFDAALNLTYQGGIMITRKTSSILLPLKKVFCPTANICPIICINTWISALHKSAW